MDVTALYRTDHSASDRLGACSGAETACGEDWGVEVTGKLKDRQHIGKRRDHTLARGQDWCHLLEMHSRDIGLEHDRRMAGIESDDPDSNRLLIGSGSEQRTALIAQRQQHDEKDNERRCDAPRPTSHSHNRSAL